MPPAVKRVEANVDLTWDPEHPPINNVHCDGEVVDIASLVPDPDNPMLHGERNLEEIEWMFRRFGQREPLVVRSQDRMVAAGNGRLTVVKRLGWTKVAVTMRPMTDHEFHLYAVGANKVARSAIFDTEVLQRLDRMSAEAGADALPGFSLHELELLRGDDGPAQDPSALWTGMPEFDQQDLTSDSHVVVHFRNDEDRADFLRIVGQEPGDVRQKSIWHPKADIGRFADKRYVAANGDGVNVEEVVEEEVVEEEITEEVTDEEGQETEVVG